MSIKNGNTVITNGEEVSEGTLLSITATPNTGYELVSITNNDNIYASETFTVNSTANFVATFKELASDGCLHPVMVMKNASCVSVTLS